MLDSEEHWRKANVLSKARNATCNNWNVYSKQDGNTEEKCVHLSSFRLPCTNADNATDT